MTSMIMVRMEKTEPLVETLAKVMDEHPLLVVIEVKRLNNGSYVASNLSRTLWKTS